jgi:hypothetical protein
VYVLLGLAAAAFLLFVVCSVVGWFVALGLAIYKTVRGQSPPRDRRGIEQDSAGVEF